MIKDLQLSPIFIILFLVIILSSCATQDTDFLLDSQTAHNLDSGITVGGTLTGDGASRLFTKHAIAGADLLEPCFSYALTGTKDEVISLLYFPGSHGAVVSFDPLTSSLSTLGTLNGLGTVRSIDCEGTMINLLSEDADGFSLITMAEDGSVTKSKMDMDILPGASSAVSFISFEAGYLAYTDTGLFYISHEKNGAKLISPIDLERTPTVSIKKDHTGTPVISYYYSDVKLCEFFTIDETLALKPLGCFDCASDGGAMTGWVPYNNGILIDDGNTLWLYEPNSGAQSPYCNSRHIGFLGDFFALSDDCIFTVMDGIPVLYRPAVEGEYKIIKIAAWEPAAGKDIHEKRRMAAHSTRTVNEDFDAYIIDRCTYYGENGYRELKAALESGKLPDLLDTTFIPNGELDEYLIDITPLLEGFESELPYCAVSAYTRGGELKELPLSYLISANVGIKEEYDPALPAESYIYSGGDYDVTGGFKAGLRDSAMFENVNLSLLAVYSRDIRAVVCKELEMSGVPVNGDEYILISPNYKIGVCTDCVELRALLPGFIENASLDDLTPDIPLSLSAAKSFVEDSLANSRSIRYLCGEAGWQTTEYAGEYNEEIIELILSVLSRQGADYDTAIE